MIPVADRRQGRLAANPADGVAGAEVLGVHRQHCRQHRAADCCLAKTGVGPPTGCWGNDVIFWCSGSRRSACGVRWPTTRPRRGRSTSTLDRAERAGTQRLGPDAADTPARISCDELELAKQAVAQHHRQRGHRHGEQHENEAGPESPTPRGGASPQPIHRASRTATGWFPGAGTTCSARRTVWTADLAERRQHRRRSCVVDVSMATATARMAPVAIDVEGRSVDQIDTGQRCDDGQARTAATARPDVAIAASDCLCLRLAPGRAVLRGSASG